jgi:hypothetical protein
MSMWVDISSLPENGKLPLISVATGVNESLEWTLTRVGDSVKTDLEFINQSIPDPNTPTEIQTFTLRIPSPYNSKNYSDPYTTGMVNTIISSGFDVKLPAPSQNAFTGIVLKCIVCGSFALVLDDQNEIYFQALQSASNVSQYKFYVDAGFGGSWASLAVSMNPFYQYVHATKLMTLLQTTYPDNPVVDIHSMHPGTFLVELSDGQVYGIYDNQGNIYHNRYVGTASDALTATTTGLVNTEWKLHLAFAAGGMSSLIYFVRNGTNTSDNNVYNAFQTPTTQFPTSDPSGNVRIFCLGFKGRGMTNQSLLSHGTNHLLKSTAYMAFNPRDESVGKYQSQLCVNLEMLLQKGLLPDRNIRLGTSDLVRFTNGDQSEVQWHLLNSSRRDNDPTWSGDNAQRFSAKYLMDHTAISGIFDSLDEYSTLSVNKTLDTIETWSGYLRIQAVINAFVEKGTSIDDIVFFNYSLNGNHVSWNAAPTNFLELKAYVKSTGKCWTLGPSTDTNVVSLITFEEQQYADKTEYIGTDRIMNWFQMSSTNQTVYQPKAIHYGSSVRYLPENLHVITDPSVLATENNSITFVLTEFPTSFNNNRWMMISYIEFFDIDGNSIDYEFTWKNINAERYYIDLDVHKDNMITRGDASYELLAWDSLATTNYNKLLNKPLMVMTPVSKPHHMTLKSSSRANPSLSFRNSRGVEIASILKSADPAVFNPIVFNH